MRGLVLAAIAIAALTLGFGSPARSSALGWCGTGESPTDRLPDAVAGPQIHVVYAIPSDGEDAFPKDAPLIVGDVSALEDWWHGEDPTRAPRFDLYSFQGCDGGLDALDLSSVRLAHDADYYRPIEGRAVRLGADLARMFFDPGKKYLVYYDGPVDTPLECGESAIAPTTGGAAATSFVYLQAAGCADDLGAGHVTAGYMAGELIHNLGAVPDAAPHLCFDHAVCDWALDVESPSPSGDPIGQLVLDYGRDDYYGHSGSWFDVRDSAWLSHVGAPQYPLAVSVAGRGVGAVASDLPGISCPGACSIGWEQGTRVTLHATAAPGSLFVGFGGACAGSADCTVTMNGPASVSATFALAVVSLAVSVRGRGAVRSTPRGITCPGHCTARFAYGTPVRLRATARRGWRFAGWSGACLGRAPCVLAENVDRAVRATFRKSGPARPGKA